MRAVAVHLMRGICVLALMFLFASSWLVEPGATTLPLTGVGGVTASHPTVVYTAGSTPAVAANSACTTCTYAALGIGAVSADRVIVVGVWGREVTARTISSVTIGGQAMTQAVVATDSSVNASTVAIYYLACNSACINATTATAVVTWNLDVVRGGVTGGALTGGATTPFNTLAVTVNAQTLSGSLTLALNGAAQCISADGSGNNNTSSWTLAGSAVSADNNSVVGTNSFSSAHKNANAAGSATMQNAYTAATTEAAMACAAWGN